jgi:uroporphyrinogen-III decarboxylase
MNMKNELTSKERMLAALNREEPDLVPIAPYAGYWYNTKVIGVPMSDWILGDVETKVKIALHAYRYHKWDWIMAGLNRPDTWKEDAIITDQGDFYDVTETHPETGQKTTRKVPKNEAPFSPTGDLTPENLLESLERECIDYDELVAGGRCYQSQRLVEEVGDEVLVTGVLGVPFGEVGCRLGLQKTLISLFRNPDLIKEAAEIILRIYIEEAKALKEVGVEAFWLEEVYAGTDILSPDQFTEFSLPYAQKLVKELHKINTRSIFYFCGGVKHILTPLLTIEADAFAF